MEFTVTVFTVTVAFFPIVRDRRQVTLITLPVVEALEGTPV